MNRPLWSRSLGAALWSLALLGLSSCQDDAALLDSNGQEPVQSHTQALAPVEEMVIVGPRDAVEGDPVEFSVLFNSSDNRKNDLIPPVIKGAEIQWSFGDGGRDVGVNVRHVFIDDTPREEPYRVIATREIDGRVQTAEHLINIRNADPTARLPQAQYTVFEGQTMTFAGTAQDPGRADILQMCWFFGDDSPAQCGPFRTIVNHAYLDGGDGQGGPLSTRLLTLSVDDGDGGSGVDTAEVTVINQPPVITMPQSLQLSQDQETTIEATVIDVPTDEVQYFWRVECDCVGGDYTIISGLEGQVVNGRADLKGIFHRLGTYTITLNVNDEDGGMSVGTVTVTVGDALPEVLLTPAFDDLPSEGQQVSFGLEADHPEGLTAWTLFWGDGTQTSHTDPEVQNNFAQGLSRFLSHAYENDGFYEARLVVTAANAQSKTDSVVVQVVNAPPEIISLQGNGREAIEGTSYGLAVTTQDTDELECLWSFGDGSDVRLGLCNGLEEHSFPNEGTYIVTVTASDGLAEDQATIDVSVRNAEPTVALEAQFGSEGSPIELVATIDDVEADTLEVTWELGDGRTFTTSDGVLEITYGDDAIYNLVVTVTDGLSVGTDSTSVSIDNVAPSIESHTGPQAVDEGSEVFLEVVAVDPGFEEALTFNWTANGQPLNDTGPSISYDVFNEGSQILNVDVCDKDDACVSQSFSVIANNVAPILAFNPAEFGSEGELYQETIVIEDPGVNDTFELELLQAPAGMEMRRDNTLVWTPSAEQARVDEPVYTVRLRVEDDAGDSSELEWTITLNFADEDDDQLPDVCEVLCPGDLEVGRQDDANADPDGDGLTNLQECLRLTNPCVSNAPGRPSLISPVAQALTGLPVVFEASAQDPDEGQRLSYNIEIYSFDDPMTPVLTRRDVQANAENALELSLVDGVSWQEDTLYRWRVSANDGAVDGPWSGLETFRFSQRNDPPSVPQPIGPSGGVIEPAPLFEFEPAVDPEGSGVYYSVELRNLTDGDDVRVYENIRMITWRPPEPLPRNVPFLWRVQAFDEEGLAGEPSGFVSLTIVEQPPSPNAKLLRPRNNTTISQLPVRFVAARPRLFTAEVAYTFELARHPSFDTLLVESNALTPDEDGLVQYTVNPSQTPREDELFFWRVKAQTADDRAPSYGSTFVLAYSTGNNAPPPPRLLSPADGELVRTVNPTLSWEASVDPEAQDVTYTVNIFEDDNGRPGRLYDTDTDVRSRGSRTDDVSWSRFIAPDHSRWWWQVEVVDAENQLSVSEMRSFSIEVKDRVLLAPELVSPPNGQVVDAGKPVLLAWRPTEDAVDLSLTYDVEITSVDREGPTVFAQVGIEGNGAIFRISTDEPLEAGFYTWRVRVASEGADPTWTRSFVFSVPGVSEGSDDPCVAEPELDGCVSPEPARYPGSASGCTQGGNPVGGHWPWLALGLLVWGVGRRRT